MNEVGGSSPSTPTKRITPLRGYLISGEKKYFDKDSWGYEGRRSLSARRLHNPKGDCREDAVRERYSEANRTSVVASWCGPLPRLLSALYSLGCPNLYFASVVFASESVYTTQTYLRVLPSVTTGPSECESGIRPSGLPQGQTTRSTSVHIGFLPLTTKWIAWRA